MAQVTICDCIELSRRAIAAGFAMKHGMTRAETNALPIDDLEARVMGWQYEDDRRMLEMFHDPTVAFRTRG